MVKKKAPKIVESYYKRSRRGKSLMSFDSSVNPKTKKIVRIAIKKDPIFKKYPKYEKAIVQHELNEAKLRASGIRKWDAHRYAEKLEPKLTRGKTIKQLWSELK
jgi:ABC-type arginine transport system ATPase subunit